MISKEPQNLWENDIIDKILLHSAFESTENFNKSNYYFHLASFSLHTSVTVYTDRINALLDATKTFLFSLKKDENKIGFQKINEKEFLTTKNSRKIFVTEKLISNFNFNSKWFGFFTSGINNFFKKNLYFKNFLRKKKEVKKKNFIFYHYSNFFIKESVQFLKIGWDSYEFEEEKKKVILQTMYQKKNFNFFFFRKLLIKKSFDSLKIIKSLKTLQKIINYFLRLDSKDFNLFYKKILNQKICYPPNFCHTHDPLVFRSRANNLIEFSELESGFFDYTIEKVLNAKKKKKFTFKWILKKNYQYQYKIPKMQDKKILVFKRETNVNFDKLILTKVAKKFPSFYKLHMKFSWKETNDSRLFCLNKKFEKKINSTNSPIFKIRLVIDFNAKHSLLNNINCTFFIINHVLEKKFQIEKFNGDFFKEKIFNIFKYVIFFQISHGCQVIQASSINKIIFLVHKNNDPYAL